MKILGAGLAGLLAAQHFQKAEILEAGEEGSTTHKALLRFRSAAVGESVGIDFTPVQVHKGIWHEGRFQQPNIQLANFYSQKVIGKIEGRSIWNLDPVTRYIAPEDFIEQLVDRFRDRIQYNAPFKDISSLDGESAISTIPMQYMLKMVNAINHNSQFQLGPEFKSAPIKVGRFRVKDCNLFQTIYYPNPESNVYRASLTKDMLIVEGVETGGAGGHEDVLESFGLEHDQIELIESTTQKFGKIAPIDDAWRRKFIFELSHRYNIFSLGRFGVFKNILLDDVLKDIGVIKRLMNGSDYERKMSQ